MNIADLPVLLQRWQRIAITGGPGTGKTTLADAVHHVRTSEMRRSAIMTVRHADDAIEHGWSGASAEVADWLDYPGPLVVEGVAVARGLRKWLRAHETGQPVDVVVVLTEVHRGIPPGSVRMAKGVHTVLEEIQAELERRGVQVIHA